MPVRFRNLFLLVASYYFYMCWVPQYAVLIAFSTGVTWLASFGVEKIKCQNKKKWALAANLFINIGILFAFKYYNFFTEIIESVFHMALPKSNLLLPVGISFYTFQALGYSIDVYRGEGLGGVRHEKNFINYALFVSFFPQLVAGPIERSKNLLPQFRQKHSFSIENTVEGLQIILVGLFKKVVIADMLAMFVDIVYWNCYEYVGLTLLCALFMFTIQIYCDFSGYSDVARGSAKIFGFELMENFKVPYMSASIKEFWSQWHISLSTWFKDYVYIPLGGGKNGFKKKLRNIMIIFLISGLWHGAKITFIIWGALHGLYRILEELLWKKRKERNEKGIKKSIKIIFVFLLVMFTWTLFRAEDLNQGIYILVHSVRGISWHRFIEEFINIVSKIMPGKHGMVVIYTILTVIAILFLFYMDWIYKYKNQRIEKIIAKQSTIVRWIFYYVMIIAVMFSFVMTTNEFGQAGAFLYFQF